MELGDFDFLGDNGAGGSFGGSLELVRDSSLDLRFHDLLALASSLALLQHLLRVNLRLQTITIRVLVVNGWEQYCLIGFLLENTETRVLANCKFESIRKS